MRKCMLGWAMTLTWNQARDAWYQGYIDDTEWELYQFYWRNGAGRFSDVSWQYQIRPETSNAR